MKTRRKKRPQHREKKGIYVLPNLFTTASLFSGFYAIIATMQERFETAAAAILISCVFDALDGKIARFTHTTSHFGSEYDSLCDLVAFGVAPGLLAYQWALAPFGRLGWIAAFLYLVCGALRLARFNVQKNTVDPGYFRGLPIPGAAGFVASLVLFTSVFSFDGRAFPFLFILCVYILSFLMVSTINYPSFKGLELRKQRPFSALVAVILTLIVIVYQPKIMLFLILTLYLLSGPFLMIYRRRTREVTKARGEDLSASAGDETQTQEESDTHRLRHIIK
ncbi:CDP-diacylglycerol--serine O-phosphatidyltransferase [Desulfatiglans anilini]|uniref:CDP-diacylglycerol--serine O-phosphatidyltransferase n=1 Tax=Desulfatiglans anilini TaxID=90728 RepID=UPI00042085DC|nr:CDP-diacylglycerol--serine O-phosphatidyltransferase [Desulfatiglans anilini]